MKKRTIKTFEEAEAYINETPRFTTKHAMEDTRAFLHRLGDPDRKMKMIHVAGTNGKGSVCAYLRSILETAGYSVAVFTSPHLVDIRERFMVSGELISREDFFRIFLKVYEALDWVALEKTYHPSYFEYLFFMAMLYFGEKNPDFCILETGLGGRLDATNAISQKALAVITRIGLDHVEYLGDTLARIAGEKAGIMAADTPAVIWDTCPETTAVFQEKAAGLGICAHFVSKKDYSFGKIMNKTIDFSLRTGYYGYISLTLRTIAAYQMENAALAVRAIEALDRGRTITAEQVQAGVEACFWAGRMEEVLPEVYVDGAHNEDGIRAFLETVAQDNRDCTCRSLLFGMVKDKDCESIVGRLAESGLFDRIAVTSLRTERGVPPKALEQLFSRYPHCTVRLYGSVREALTSLLSDRQPGERIYAAGSLYLAGEIKELVSHDKF
ncbi:MAG: bifunctional folylpolyglutamate synthase/dihydrofolate synthase [Acetatifactor sp.]|nr:bifunctional folylpolyglutamate synthase/dihydrofolate synthase [Acetatifactor sp.]